MASTLECMRATFLGCALACWLLPSGCSAPAALPDGSNGGVDGATAQPPQPSGCIDQVTSGDHVFTCEGLRVDATIPPACQRPGCGLILELHGDTGTGLLMDGHTNLRALGRDQGYIVIAPTGPAYGGGQPGSTWTRQEDAKLIAMTKLFASVFHVDAARVHVTGFSRGGFVTWRLLCDQSELFASAAPAAAGNGNNEVTCFTTGRAPTRNIDLLFLMGRTDMPVPYSTMLSIRNAAITRYGGGAQQTVRSDGNYAQFRWTTASGAVVETFDHAYETDPIGPFGDARGHCFPGSTADPQAPQYAVPCKGPNAFVWGQEVLTFFKAHPRK
jgi:polyhydroxybutyrate depolymerase